MNPYQVITQNDEIDYQNKNLLYFILHYYSFIREFGYKAKANQYKAKSNLLETESVFLINKKWMEKFLLYFNKIKFIIQNNENYFKKRNQLTPEEENRLIFEINKYMNMQYFIKSVKNMNTLRKISGLEKQEYFEEYALIDPTTNIYFQLLFKKGKYNDTSAQLIIIDMNTYILGYNDNGKIEVVKQSNDFVFLYRYLVIFKSALSV